MIFRNEFTFGGEVVKKKDFGDNSGGNITVSGISKIGEVKLSVLLSNKLFKTVCDKDYPKVIVFGHIEQRTHETDTGNIKHSLRYVADDLQLVS